MVEKYILMGSRSKRIGPEKVIMSVDLLNRVETTAMELNMSFRQFVIRALEIAVAGGVQEVGR